MGGSSQGLKGDRNSEEAAQLAWKEDWWGWAWWLQRPGGTASIWPRGSPWSTGGGGRGRSGLRFPARPQGLVMVPGKQKQGLLATGLCWSS